MSYEHGCTLVVHYDGTIVILNGLNEEVFTVDYKNGDVLRDNIYVCMLIWQKIRIDPDYAPYAVEVVKQLTKYTCKAFWDNHRKDFLC